MFFSFALYFFRDTRHCLRMFAIAPTHLDNCWVVRQLKFMLWHEKRRKHSAVHLIEAPLQLNGDS